MRESALNAKQYVIGTRAGSFRLASQSTFLSEEGSIKTALFQQSIVSSITGDISRVDGTSKAPSPTGDRRLHINKTRAAHITSEGHITRGAHIAHEVHITRRRRIYDPSPTESKYRLSRTNGTSLRPVGATSFERKRNIISPEGDTSFCLPSPTESEQTVI